MLLDTAARPPQSWYGSPAGTDHDVGHRPDQQLVRRRPERPERGSRRSSHDTSVAEPSPCEHRTGRTRTDPPWTSRTRLLAPADHGAPCWRPPSVHGAE